MINGDVVLLTTPPASVLLRTTAGTVLDVVMTEPCALVDVTGTTALTDALDIVVTGTFVDNVEVAPLGAVVVDKVGAMIVVADCSVTEVVVGVVIGAR